MKKLNFLHRKLRRLRYFYYECEDILLIDKNTIPDQQYDRLEQIYKKLCNKLNIPYEKRVNNYVGFDIAIPMNLYYERDDKSIS